MRMVLALLLLFIVVFLGAFIPPTLESRHLRETLQTTNVTLRLANLHRRLGAASLEAERNNYANAAIAAKSFFEGCRVLAASNELANEPRTREALASYASQSGDITAMITLADPQVKDRLATLYLTMDGVLQRRQ